MKSREIVAEHPASRGPLGLRLNDPCTFNVRLHTAVKNGQKPKLAAVSAGAGEYSRGSIELLARPWLKLRMALE